MASGEEAVTKERGPLRLHSAAAVALVVLALAATSSCVSDKSLYSWGHYEDSVYRVCHGADTFDLAKDVQLLSQEIDRAHAEGRRVAPGIHAHLGYLYYVSGNTGAAIEHFIAEKQLYPESATFIDGMLARTKT